MEPVHYVYKVVLQSKGLMLLCIVIKSQPLTGFFFQRYILMFSIAKHREHWNPVERFAWLELLYSQGQSEHIKGQIGMRIAGPVICHATVYLRLMPCDDIQYVLYSDICANLTIFPNY